MKLTPSSTARRRTAIAAAGSLGGPQIPSPVIRMAPKPRRCTVSSPPSEIVPLEAAHDNGSTLLIDSGVDTQVTELRDAIFNATMRHVTRLVNTHWHFDHTGGNVFFGSAGVTIIAQENVKKRLSSVQDVPFVGLRDGHYPPEALPTVTYSSSMTLHQGPQQLILVNYGTAHTDADTVVYVSTANVAVVGDIFSNHFYPIIDLASGGSIDGVIHSLDEILARTDEQTKIVPGHGSVAT